MTSENLFSVLGEPRDEPWCLAFSNTVSSRGHENQQDLLKTLDDLRSWLQRKQILRPEATASGEDLRNFERATRLREAIYRVGSAIAARQSPSLEDVDEINWNVQRAIVAARLEPSDEGLAWSLDSLRGSIAGAIGLLALSAAGLFASPLAQRVRECGNPTCGWLFLDLSKNRSRKWCDMADCGNLAKARRYYARQKAIRQGLAAPIKDS